MSVGGDIVMTCEFCNLDFRFGRARSAARRARHEDDAASPRRSRCCRLLAAACGGPSRSCGRDFPPLRYDYLTQLRLNVADIELPSAAAADPLDALRTRRHPRRRCCRWRATGWWPGGSLGRAVFVVDEAWISRVPDGLQGALAVHLDVLTSDGTRAGFAEAGCRASWSGSAATCAAALYDITRQMMHDMNVEFEYPASPLVARLAAGAGHRAAAAPVEQQPLGPAVARRSIAEIDPVRPCSAVFTGPVGQR